jgi:hypothetical protein
MNYLNIFMKSVLIMNDDLIKYCTSQSIHYKMNIICYS